ncbi:hypothetical protein O3M35_006220 [Rhynocoris fuscipes]|uniref:Transmembrane protein n=1 Tax=Rhynocoris fuscipes TaxID=488301 RepID=A0AAW1DF19_9HEMI
MGAQNTRQFLFQKLTEFAESFLKTVIVILVSCIWNLYIFDYGLSKNPSVVATVSITTSAYVIYCVVMLIMNLSKEEFYDISEMIFHYSLGSLCIACAILVKNEPIGITYQYPQLLFTSLGITSFTYAGFFLLYPRLKPDKTLRDVSTKQVRIVSHKRKLDETNLFIYIPLNGSYDKDLQKVRKLMATSYERRRLFPKLREEQEPKAGTSSQMPEETKLHSLDSNPKEQPSTSSQMPSQVNIQIEKQEKTSFSQKKSIIDFSRQRENKDNDDEDYNNSKNLKTEDSNQK